MFRSVIPMIVRSHGCCVCGAKKNAASGPSAKPVIGCSLYDMKTGVLSKMEKGTRERALELGYGFHLARPGSGDELQMVSGWQEPSKSSVAA